MSRRRSRRQRKITRWMLILTAINLSVTFVHVISLFQH